MAALSIAAGIFFLLFGLAQIGVGFAGIKFRRYDRNLADLLQ
ncbi:hypothetical protein [Variovorax sp. LjRoot178]